MDHELAERLYTTFKKLRMELQAVRWAMWYAIDAWEQGKPFHLACAKSDHATDIGISLVHEGRLTEQQREAKGLNDPLKIELELFGIVSANTTT